MTMAIASNVLPARFPQLSERLNVIVAIAGQRPTAQERAVSYALLGSLRPMTATASLARVASTLEGTVPVYATRAVLVKK